MKKFTDAENNDGNQYANSDILRNELYKIVEQFSASVTNLKNP